LLSILSTGPYACYIGQADENTIYRVGVGCRLKHREFEYVGDVIPKIDKERHADFIFNYQRSILQALVKRGLLTLLQCEKCIEELEHQQERTAKP